MKVIPVKCSLCTNSAKYVQSGELYCYPHWLAAKPGRFMARYMLDEPNEKGIDRI